MRAVRVGDHWIGDGRPIYIVAEIGINHNGDVPTAKWMIDAAVEAGCDAVKFQKRNPMRCVPPSQRDNMRETPWGYINYLEYRQRVEFDRDQYWEIAQYCFEKNIAWTASCWDESSVDFIEEFNPPFYKIASAAVTDHDLLRRHCETGRPLVLSTGMSTMNEIHAAVDLIGTERLVLVHSTSAYPCPLEELNLKMIATLRESFDCPVGYSGHEVGLPTTVAAVTLGASYVERHITLDRAMWGSDQAASVEPGGFERLVKYIRAVEKGMGDGVKRVYESEIPVMKKLRRVRATA
jgi:N-acetylneuraminate synthase